MSEREIKSPTKKYKSTYIVFKIISLLCFYFPALYFITEAFINSELTVQKCALVSMVLVSLILTAVSLINKKAMRSRIWLLILGIYFCCDHFLLAIVLVAITQIIDELILTPITNHYKQKYSINKEMDKRL